MNTKTLLFTAFLAAATAVSAPAAPILIRHDRDEAAYLDLGRQYAEGLCHVLNDRGVVNGEGTLIAPRWVVTAAHVARGLRPGQALKIGEASVAVAQVFLHPKWGGPSPEHDIALVRLREQVVGVEPVPLYRGRDEGGREIIVVGAGMRGTGLTGPVEDDGKTRGATNRIVEAAEAWLRFVFDAPEAENATDLEGISGPGDSGGPALLVIDGTAYLAGISSGQDDAATGGQPGRYGVSEYYTRVSSYLPWIEQTMQGAETDVVRGDLGEELDAYMNRLAAQGFSGGLLVAKDGAVVLSKGYGMADRARGLLFTNETVFPIGSITKQFTGAAILKLEMMGRLRVEDLISHYFDDVPADKAGITLHHLLTHSAGFGGALGFDFAAISRDEYVAQALDSELSFEPGTAYDYSNVGFSLLAAIVEQLTGGSYDAFVQEHLFAPAGLTKTGYVFSRWQPDDLAHGYRDDEDWGTFADHPWADDGPYWHLRGNGGLLSTLGDMYQWHLALEGDAVLSEAAKEKYYARHVREGDGAPSFYGYGWSVMDSRHGHLITHNGGNPYFESDFLRFIDADVVIYMTSNSASHRATRLSRTIVNIAFGEPYEMPPETIEALSKEELAETPVGRHTMALLDVLATTDEDATRRFIEEHFAPRVLEQYSMDDLLGEFAKDQQNIGAVEVARIVKTGAHSFEMTVQSKASGEWWLFRVRGEPEPPHRFVGFGVMDTMPPAQTVTNAPTAPVTGPPGDKWQFPDSATGRALKALLTTIDQGDDARTRQFVEQHLDEDFREEYSMDEHVAFFRQLHNQLPDLDVEQVNKTGPYSVEFMLVSGQSDHKVKATFTLEPQPPHRFVGMDFQPVEEGQ